MRFTIEIDDKAIAEVKERIISGKHYPFGINPKDVTDEMAVELCLKFDYYGIDDHKYHVLPQKPGLLIEQMNNNDEGVKFPKSIDMNKAFSDSRALADLNKEVDKAKKDYELIGLFSSLIRFHQDGIPFVVCGENNESKLYFDNEIIMKSKEIKMKIKEIIIERYPKLIIMFKDK